MTTEIDIGTVRTMKPLLGRLWAPDYTSPIFNPVDFQALVDKTVKAVRILKKKLKINCLASCGNSGTVLASVVSYRTKLPLMVVRKKGDNRHDVHEVNGFRQRNTKYLIIDDLISSGNTCRWIVKSITVQAEKENSEKGVLPLPECGGILLYKDSGWDQPVYNFDISTQSTYDNHKAVNVSVYDMKRAFPELEAIRTEP